MTLKKPKILLLSDDLRWSSGIATMSKSIVKNTLDRFDWVQVGAAIQHPDNGKIFDMDQMAQVEWGIPDAHLKVYATTGYGSPDLIRQLLTIEKPDAILHFTDPRFWIWLYEIEHEIREHVPLLFYHIWDDLPFPMYNRNFYESCDWIGCISRQTYNIVNQVWGSTRKSTWHQPDDWQVSYVPHGIDPKEFYPINENHNEWPELQKLKAEVTSTIGKSPEDIDFVVTWINRNIRRKMPADVILAFKQFCDKLTPQQADRCLLLMHTAPIDPNGTDLFAVREEICPDYHVVFSGNTLDTPGLNRFLNFGDVTVNVASNEGFGLTTCESLMAGTPIIVNVTGGLQDQCGFRDENGELVTIDHFSAEWGSNHDGRYTDHGEWVIPIFPASRNLTGSPPTPYIFDDRVRPEDLADAIHQWYLVPKHKRQQCGEAGREYCLGDGGLSAENMANRMADGIMTALETWTPRPRFELIQL